MVELQAVPRLLRAGGAPLATQYRTHLGYITFEGRLGKPLNNEQKFYLQHKENTSNNRGLQRCTCPIRHTCSTVSLAHGQLLRRFR